jgi:hypothetical protein
MSCRSIAVLPLALVIAACGSPQSPPAARQLPRGVTNAADTARYVATIDAGARRTRVVALATRSGRVLRSMTLPGAWVIPAVVGNDRSGSLSGDQHTIALAGPSGEGTADFALLDTQLATAPRKFSLHGRWSYDAISPDGDTVYLLEHAAAGHYRVRAYDAGAGRLRAGVIVEKGETEEDMTGTPLARAVARGGSPVYTLYRRGARGAFVHALDTEYGVARCVDLPAGGRWRLVWSVAGQRLYAVDRGSGKRVQVTAA